MKIFSVNFLIILLMVGCDTRIANHVPGSNPWLDGNLGQFAKFSSVADEGPVVMINLLKFTRDAKNGAGTGAESYAKYGELATPFVEKHGGRLIWSGVPTQQLVGDMDYDWDLVLLVSWPKRQSLLDLGADEGYQAIAHHRIDGLKRTMLIALDETYPLYGKAQ